MGSVVCESAMVSRVIQHPQAFSGHAGDGEDGHERGDHLANPVVLGDVMSVPHVDDPSSRRDANRSGQTSMRNSQSGREGEQANGALTLAALRRLSLALQL